MRNKLLAAASIAALVALPAIAQNQVQTAPPATTPSTSPPATASPTPSPTPSPSPRPSTSGAAEIEAGVAELEALELPPPPPPVEMPEHARRDPWSVGPLDPVQLGLGARPWGGASGAFLSTLMRRMNTPLASRWAHMAVRNALLASARAPRNVNPVDWAAERAWLLLRMGEADAARMIVASVDVDQFTPKMFQVAVQSALATADPPALCPLEDGLDDVEPRVLPLIEAMCASLSGEPESAAAQIDTARRRGRVGGIDLVLAEKVVGAGADTGRAVTVEWEPVERLNSWRFGLATATGMTLPERLVDDAPPRVLAWQARAPLLSAAQRLDAARVATGLGVFSSQALTDLYAAIYDATDPSALSETDAWQLRVAYIGRDVDTRMAAMRRLWGGEDAGLQREASRALLGRAAARIQPDADLQEDCANLIASMLAAGFDRHAARWIPAVRRMDEQYADRCWGMLALAAPSTNGLDISIGRINAFISRDTSRGKVRSALLVAGLAGLGRIDATTTDRLNRRHGLRIGHRTRWTRLIDNAAAFGQAGSVVVLTGTGFQTPEFEQLPSSHMFHAAAALKRTGQEFAARMIAAEAIART